MMLRTPSILIVCACALFTILSSCDREEDRRPIDPNSTDTDNQGTDTNGNGTGDTDSPTSQTQGKTNLSGLVQAPSGIVPISGALVYLTQGQVEEIPSGVYHYECDNMVGTIYTLSGPDGTWRLEKVPAGQWKIVTRKGNFRRVRTLEVPSDGEVQVPWEDTTLPGRNSDDGLDRVPSMAVLLSDWDRTYNLLAKFGMGQVDGKGWLVYGTESFDLYNDEISKPGYPPSSELFTVAGRLDEYQMIFLPCAADTNPMAFVKSHAEQLRQYVSKGGKVYNSCCVALWTEAAFPDYIDFYQNDDLTKYDIGRISSEAYSTTGTLQNDDLAAWMKAVDNLGPTDVPFSNGYVKIDAVVDVEDGHGLEQDNGWVKPYVWVEDSSKYPGAPLMVTYNYDFGKVFYSVYETARVETTLLTPQESVLLFVMLEIGVCENLPPV